MAGSVFSGVHLFAVELTAVIGGQSLLAQADGVRRHFDQLVIVDEFQRFLQ